MKLGSLTLAVLCCCSVGGLGSEDWSTAGDALSRLVRQASADYGSLQELLLE